MVTNHWVWHSPFFGAIIRYVDFYYIGEGYEQYMERMRKKVKEGYSIAIFPEGTRTYNGSILSGRSIETGYSADPALR